VAGLIFVRNTVPGKKISATLRVCSNLERKRKDSAGSVKSAR